VAKSISCHPAPRAFLQFAEKRPFFAVDRTRCKRSLPVGRLGQEIHQAARHLHTPISRVADSRPPQQANFSTPAVGFKGDDAGGFVPLAASVQAQCAYVR
jgi:hypothetical protein